MCLQFPHFHFSLPHSFAYLFFLLFAPVWYQWNVSIFHVCYELPPSRRIGKGQPQQQQQQQMQAPPPLYGGGGCGPMGTQAQIGVPGGMGSARIIDPTFPTVLGSHPNITNPGGAGGVPSPSSLGSQLVVSSARTRGGMLRTDSLSSDQSHVEAHHHRRRHSRKLGKKKKRSSTSSMTAGIIHTLLLLC